MAGNANSGPGIAFKMSEEQLKEKISEYKQLTADGVVVMPSWPDFCSRLAHDDNELGYSEAEVAECIKQGEDKKSAYYKRSLMLKRHLTWMRGQIQSSGKFTRTAQSMGIFALKQDHGDGVKYTDQANGAAGGPMTVHINFGGDDPRGKKAAD